MTENITTILPTTEQSNDNLLEEHAATNRELSAEQLRTRIHNMMHHKDDTCGIFGICSIPDILEWKIHNHRGPHRLYHGNNSHPTTFWLPGVLKDVNLRNQDGEETPTISVSIVLFGRNSAAEARALLNDNDTYPVHSCRQTPLIGAWHHQRLLAAGDSGYERDLFNNVWDGRFGLTSKANMEHWENEIKTSDVVLLEVEVIRYHTGSRGRWGPASFDLKHIVVLESGCGHQSCGNVHCRADTLPDTF